ncbi:MAG: hypothetical protein ACM3TN_21050, partial [Alphaproteobacteria bacterium]
MARAAKPYKAKPIDLDRHFASVHRIISGDKTNSLPSTTQDLENIRSCVFAFPSLHRARTLFC